MSATPRPSPEPFHRSAIRAWSVVVRGAEVYDRSRMLTRLLPVTIEECRRTDRQTAERIVKLLARAVRIERAKGRSGHWSYDLNRHVGLLQAFKAERRTVAATRQTPGHEKSAAE